MDDGPFEADEFVEGFFEDAFLVGVGAVAEGSVFFVDHGSDAVALDALGAEVGHVGGAGGHGGDGGDAGVDALPGGFDGAEGFVVEARRGRGGTGVAVFLDDLDLGVVDDFLDFRAEGFEVFVRQGADVEDGFGFRRDDVDLEAAADDVGRDGGAEHGVVAGFVVGEVLLDFGGSFGVVEGVVAGGVFGFADGGEAFEVVAGGVVHAHGGLVLGDAGDSLGEVGDGVGFQGAGAVAGGAFGDEFEGVGDFFGGLDGDVGGFAFAADAGAAFGEADFGFDFGPVFADHVFDADLGGGLFAGFGEEDDVAVEGDVVALEQEHGHEDGGDVVLVIDGAAAIDVAAVAGGGEGRVGPEGGEDADDVGVGHEEEGAFGAIALEAGDEVGAVGFEGEEFGGDAFGFEDFFEVFGGLGFVAGRVLGIHAEKRLEVAHGFRFDFGPIGFGGGEGSGKEEKGSPAHGAMVALQVWGLRRAIQESHAVIFRLSSIGRGGRVNRRYTPCVVILIAAAAAAWGQGIVQSRGSSVSGTVVDGAGSGLRGLEVIAVREQIKRTAITDENGRYRLSGLEPGRYKITVSQQIVRQAPRVIASREIVVNQDQDLSGIDIRARPLGEISGRILDANREPISGIKVFLVASEYSLGAVRHGFALVATSDDRGAYHLRGVDSGRGYLIFAQKTRPYFLDPVSDSPAAPKLRRPATISTFYPDSPSVEAAGRVTLLPGEKRDNIDIVMARAPAFCLEGVVGGGPGSKIFQIREKQPSVGFWGESLLTMPVPTGKTKPDGAFRICDLAPGDYELTAISGDPEEPGLLGSAPVTITDRDISGFAIVPLPPVILEAEIVWAEGDSPESAPGPAPDIGLTILPVGRNWFRGEAKYLRQSVPDRFTVDGLFVGDYSVRISGLPAYAHINDVTYGGLSILGMPLSVGSGFAGARLQIIVARDGGTLAIAAVASARSDDPAPGAYVSVMPADVQAEAAMAASLEPGQTDDAGLWSSRRLAPGRYRVLVTSEPIDRSPESIGKLWRSRSSAREVEVKPGANVQVTVPLSSIE